MAEIQKYTESELKAYKKTLDLLSALPNKDKVDIPSFAQTITQQTITRLKLLKECASTSSDNPNLFKLSFTDTLGYGHSSQGIEGYEHNGDAAIYHLQHKDNVRDTSNVWDVDITLENNQLSGIRATKTKTKGDQADVSFKLEATFVNGSSSNFSLEYNNKTNTPGPKK